MALVLFCWDDCRSFGIFPSTSGIFMRLFCCILTRQAHIYAWSYSIGEEENLLLNFVYTNNDRRATHEEQCIWFEPRPTKVRQYASESKNSHRCSRGEQFEPLGIYVLIWVSAEDLVRLKQMCILRWPDFRSMRKLFHSLCIVHLGLWEK